MAECQHCGAFVSENFVRVFARDETAGVQGCPNCKDKVVTGGGGIRSEK